MAKILGISAFYHDSAAALIVDGTVVAAVQEERFSRIKNDEGFPLLSIKYLLDLAEMQDSKLDAVVFYEKPLLKFERIVQTVLASGAGGFQFYADAMFSWLGSKIFFRRLIKRNLKAIAAGLEKTPIYFSEHHLSHCASAFYPSPFEQALAITMDGVGEWATASVALGSGTNLSIEKEIFYPDSLGLFYSAITDFCGFRPNDGEYKLMGLAPYGQARFLSEIQSSLLKISEGGDFFLDKAFAKTHFDTEKVRDYLTTVFGVPRRNIGEKLNPIYMDIAASAQVALENAVINLVESQVMEYGIRNVCLAGGVALNCAANGKLLALDSIDAIWVQPASGDAGGAIGAALAFAFKEFDQKRIVEPFGLMKGSYLGPKYNSESIKNTLDSLGAVYVELEDEQPFLLAAKKLSEGHAIAWMRGNMEFGPRALGNRSILLDPRIKDGKDQLNQRIKFREGFRPFAPSVLKEHQNNIFRMSQDDHFMTFLQEVRPKEEILDFVYKKDDIVEFENSSDPLPVVTHINQTARVHTVTKALNGDFYQLIEQFYLLTGCPLLVNTSFNTADEPIVESPADAYRCFLNTNIEFLFIENFALEKKLQKYGR